MYKQEESFKMPALYSVMEHSNSNHFSEFRKQILEPQSNVRFRLATNKENKSRKLNNQGMRLP